MSANEQERYVPLSERLNKDVWHDNFIYANTTVLAGKPITTNRDD